MEYRLICSVAGTGSCSSRRSCHITTLPSSAFIIPPLYFFTFHSIGDLPHNWRPSPLPWQRRPACSWKQGTAGYPGEPSRIHSGAFCVVKNFPDKMQSREVPGETEKPVLSNFSPSQAQNSAVHVFAGKHGWSPSTSQGPEPGRRMLTLRPHCQTPQDLVCIPPSPNPQQERNTER